MTTNQNGVKCAGCKGYHPTVADVRKCFQGEPVVTAQRFPAAAIGPKGTGDQPATDKQVAFIERLRVERGVPVLKGLSFTKREATMEIERLLAMPKAPPASHPQAATKAEPLTDGMYRKDETIYKIQRAVHGSGHLYAKRLVPGDGYGAKASFVYAPGAMKVLTLADKMTLAEAKEWGALYGTCCVCGRTLTNEQSIEAGIGPVCAGKGQWA
jgi:hypothetical protein